ncbi:MAG: hypothetical protein PUD48_02105 [Megasphaera elsdenii]|uniref:hypothetical protein n=1 Tax=Megasphaera elsdenii TaxID=907 RepID=UPI00242C3FA8|nr:hypothetical protein [Megasphaera elsdenii]MDD6860885.1 hypothetical protein [Megasphaera elsdenii]
MKDSLLLDKITTRIGRYADLSEHATNPEHRRFLWYLMTGSFIAFAVARQTDDLEDWRQSIDEHIAVFSERLADNDMLGDARIGVTASLVAFLLCKLDLLENQPDQHGTPIDDVFRHLFC